MKRTAKYDVNLTINGEVENADLIICGWHYQNDFDQFDHNMSSSPKHALISEVKRLLAQDQVPGLDRVTSLQKNHQSFRHNYQIWRKLFN